MILVADASALIALAACNSLALLDAIFGKVIVPETVYLEVTQADKPQSDRLRSYLQGKVRAVDMQRYVLLDAFADIGETAAMLLYKEAEADYLLIDDRRGRKVAKINQIKTIGSLGVLLQAKRMGLVPRVKPLIDLIAASPVYIGKNLMQIVLELAGEPAEQGSANSI
jgi:predicted nucleic acid-binding protein